MKRVISVLLTLVLMAVFDGTLLLACPSITKACNHCPAKSKPVHCPYRPSFDRCPLLDGEQFPGVMAAPPAIDQPAKAEWLPVVGYHSAQALETPDWHHAQGLHLRLRVFRN